MTATRWRTMIKITDDDHSLIAGSGACLCQGTSITFWNPAYDMECSPALAKIAHEASSVLFALLDFILLALLGLDCSDLGGGYVWSRILYLRKVAPRHTGPFCLHARHCSCSAP